MNYLEEAVESIKEHEGFRREPYKDSVGVWTIGHGLTYLTQKESELVMRHRLVNEYLPLTIDLFPSFETLSVARQVVLLNMCYNLGPNRLATFTRLRAAIVDGNYDLAADEMLDSRWAKQVGDLEGERAWELAEIMRSDSNPWLTQ